jgi:antitoxin MazE
LSIRSRGDVHAKIRRAETGQLVEISVEEVGLSIVPFGSRDMSLAERLRQFDPSLHGGEAMVAHRVGREAIGAKGLQEAFW